MPEPDRYRKVVVNIDPEPMPHAKVNTSPELVRAAPLGRYWWSSLSAQISFAPGIGYAGTLDIGHPVVRSIPEHHDPAALTLELVADMLTAWAHFAPPIVMWDDPDGPDAAHMFQQMPRVLPMTRARIIGRCWFLACVNEPISVRRGKVIRELYYRPRVVL